MSPALFPAFDNSETELLATFPAFDNSETKLLAATGVKWLKTRSFARSDSTPNVVSGF